MQTDGADMTWVRYKQDKPQTKCRQDIGRQNTEKWRREDTDKTQRHEHRQSTSKMQTGLDKYKQDADTTLISHQTQTNKPLTRQWRDSRHWPDANRRRHVRTRPWQDTEYIQGRQTIQTKINALPRYSSPQHWDCVQLLIIIFKGRNHAPRNSRTRIGKMKYGWQENIKRARG